MIDLDALNVARQEYVKYVVNFWDVLKAQGAELANCETEKSSAIVKYWTDNGAISDLLSPLLLHELEAVRYAAAADMLKQGFPERAISVLREIAKNPEGLLAPTARLLLMKKRIALTD